MSKHVPAHLNAVRPAYNFIAMAGRFVAGDSVDDAPRILVVEDDSVARDALCALLADAGYEVTAAVDGSEALESVRAVDPDLMITDLAMPTLNGFEVIRSLRRTAGRSELPVIIVSANDQIQQRVRGLDLGADDFMAKPIDFDELLARVRRQLTRSKRRRLLERESSADALTGVLNRRGIMELLAQELDQVSAGHEVAVVMIDLDDFKGINDNHGHLVGDLALCTVARELEGALRDSDRVSRLGGDEFLVVIPGAGRTALGIVLERLRALSPISVTVSSTVELRLHLSFGHTRAERGDTVATLLERADRAMYANKRRARGH
jgi:diguanylate cyclase (GGDEF)-like protein